MVGTSFGPWLMPLGVAALAFLLSAFRRGQWFRLVTTLLMGVLIAVAVDVCLRGVALIALGSPWDWLFELLVSTLLAGIGAVAGGGAGALLSLAVGAVPRRDHSA
jgi:hypothetical protein